MQEDLLRPWGQETPGGPSFLPHPWGLEDLRFRLYVARDGMMLQYVRLT